MDRSLERATVAPRSAPDLLDSGYRYALSLTHDPTEAENLVQDACLAILAAGGPLERSYLWRRRTTMRLDDRLRDYYGGQRLRPEARARLEEIVRAGGLTRRGGWTWWLRTAAAALFVIGATAGALWVAVFGGAAEPGPRELALSVARQAALEHNRTQELEFRVARTADLREAMKSLDFTPVEPERMEAMEMRVVGARYATIQGVLAAEIRYLEPDGNPCTLYLARPVDRLASVPEGEHDIDGVRVTLWREKGLLMVLARPLA